MVRPSPSGPSADPRAAPSGRPAPDLERRHRRHLRCRCSRAYRQRPPRRAGHRHQQHVLYRRHLLMVPPQRCYTRPARCAPSPIHPTHLCAPNRRPRYGPRGVDTGLSPLVCAAPAREGRGAISPARALPSESRLATSEAASSWPARCTPEPSSGRSTHPCEPGCPCRHGRPRSP